MSLNGLIFSDLFVASEPRMSWFKPTPDSLSVLAVPESCHAELAKLRTELDAHNGKSGFKVLWPKEGQDSQRMRVERIAAAHDETIFVCRRFRVAPSELGSLGVPKAIAAKLMGEELSSGLVVFFGKAGAGKSTTASSFMCERLARFGGVSWTVENPIELDLQGQHGKGRCYQTEVEDDGQIGAAIRQLMRGTPNIIFIGELRDGRAVAEAVTAALSGHLVVSTFHSGDLMSGLSRLSRLAQGANLDNKDMAAALADALKVGLHLSLHNYDPDVKRPGAEPGAKGVGTPPRVLSVEPLFITESNGDAMRTIIRDGEFQKLNSEIQRQQRSLMMHGLP